jgi:transcriptional regulator with GAF, ATPase, and Fis domain
MRTFCDQWDDALSTTLVPRPEQQARAATDLDLLALDHGGLSTYALPKSGGLRIGRAVECDVRLRDPLVSRRHATLHVWPLCLEDHGSANGTAISDRRIDPGVVVPVQPGQLVAIGSSLLLVRHGTGRGVAVARRARQSARSEQGDPIVIQDAAMVELFAMIDRIAASGINILVLGETGVGKDVVARAIHQRSTRRSAPFMRINCAALSEALLESELFGHERGAFTGAVATKHGLIEAADGGTAFLDEVGELPLGLQAKLLHAIEARRVTRVGSVRSRDMDVRFIAATNRDLAAEVARGTFRADLFFRLNGLRLHVPPLRQRVREVPALAEAFLGRIAEQMGLTEPPKLTAEAVEKLVGYGWPGNVRELRNVVERAVLLRSAAGSIGAEDLSFCPIAPGLGSTIRAASAALDDTDARRARRDEDRRRRDEERRRIIEALNRCQWNQTRAAELLVMPRRTFVAKLAAYEIPRPRKRTQG